jgi:hypothetical protein
MDWGTPSGDKVLSYLGQLAQIKKIEAELKRILLQRSSNDDRVQQATRDTYTWVTEHTETYNEHWVEEGRPSPYEKLPKLPYLLAVFELLESERIVWFEKSRDLLLSWSCVAFFTLGVQKVPRRSALFQTQKEKKAIQLVDYAKCLYRRQDPRIQAHYPLTKAIDDQPALELHFANGSSIIGIPGGADQIRSYHPWGYLNDESSFQPDAGECYNEALAAVKGKIVFNSSAGPGWYADARRGIIRNEE